MSSIRFPLVACALIALAFALSFSLTRALSARSAAGPVAASRVDVLAAAPPDDSPDDSPDASPGDAVAVLDLLFDGPDLFVDLDAPAATLLGFAHAPSTAAEHGAMARAHRLLDAGDLLVPSPAARCALDQSFAMVGHGYDDLCSAATDGDAGVAPVAGRIVDPLPDGARPDVAARWSWVCDAPERLERVEVRLFDAFDGVGALDVRLAGPAGDARAGLVPGRPVIALAPVR